MRKSPHFYLAVSDFLLTFATVYKMIEIYPAERPFRLWLRSRRLFYAQEYHFADISKKVYLYGGCMNRKIWLVLRISHRLLSNGECSRHPFLTKSSWLLMLIRWCNMQNSILLNDAMQVKPAGIHVNVNEGMKSNKCAISREAKRLWATRSETFSYLCEESVSYGMVVWL